MTLPFMSFLGKEKGKANLRKAAELYHTYIHTCIRLAEQRCRFACESESSLKKFLDFTHSFWRKAVCRAFSFTDSELSYKTGGCHSLRIHLEFNKQSKGVLR